jgi:hypothetical protein
MKLVKPDEEVLDTLENNVKSLNRILKDWCNKSVSYNRREETLDVHVNILKDILTQLNVVFSEKDRHVSGGTEAYWIDNYFLSFVHGSEFLNIKDKQGLVLTYILSVDWLPSSEFIPKRFSRKIVLSKVTPENYYIVEWKDLNISLIRQYLKNSNTDIHSIDQKIESLSKKNPDLNDLSRIIPILHESFLELSDSKTLVSYELFEMDSHGDIWFQWRVMDFSQSMIIDYADVYEEDDENPTCKLLIPCISFIIVVYP